MGKPGLIFSVLVLLVVLAACNKPMPKEESVKYLRAADNEIIQIGRQINETLAYSSLRVLMAKDEVPLPSFFRNNTDRSSPGEGYVFEDYSGVYSFNYSSGKFKKEFSSDSVIIIFPYLSSRDSTAKFILAEYQEESSLLQMPMATVINARIMISGICVFSLQYRGKMDQGIPVEVELLTKFGNFNLDFSQKTRLFRDYAKMQANLALSNSERNLFEGEMLAKIILSNSGEYLFDETTVGFNIFPVEIFVEVDYGNIDTRSRGFVQEYNHYSSICVYSQEKHQKIADIQLREREQSDKLNFIVCYGDDSFDYLEDFMLSARSIFNMKLD